MNKSWLEKIKAFGGKHPIVFPLVLLLAALISYGIFGFICGFYWDDWPPVLLSNINKANVFWNAYGDRPYSAWTYALMFPLLRNSAPAWQLATIVLRVAGTYLFYLTLSELFPRQKPIFQWAALISLVLPIFTFQYISVAFSQHFLTYTLFTGSLYLLVMSIRKPKLFWLFYPLSLLLTAAHMFMMEYFVGLEVLRPIFLFIALKNQGLPGRKPWAKTFLLLLPSLAILGFYIYWRMIVFPVTQIADSSFSNNFFLLQEFSKSPTAAINKLLGMAIQDFRTVFVTSWIDRLWPADILYNSKVLWLSQLVGLGVAGIFTLFYGQKKEGSPWISAHEFLINCALGLLIFVSGVLPVWVTLRQVSVGKYSDRFALAVLPGIALILVTLVFKIAGSGRMRNILLSLIVMVSVGYQIQIGNVYRKDNLRQQSFYSQLKWRIPTLKPGTAIYSPSIISGKEADYSYSMGINLLYDEEIHDSLNYWFLTPRYQPVTNLVEDKNIQIDGVIRGPEFTGISANVVSVYMPDSGCLLVLDPIYAQYPSGVENFSAYGDLTNFDQIVDTGSEKVVFPQAFGKISSDQWCYYFEQADLARQQKNWPKVIQIYDTASGLGFKPTESIEYIPLIQALAESGNAEKAIEVTATAMKRSKEVNLAACKLWGQLLQENPNISIDNLSILLGENVCSTAQP